MVSTRAAKLVAIGVIVAGTLVAESRKEFHFAVGPKAGISVPGMPEVIHRLKDAPSTSA